ncbi:ABC transporter substrate-binding protein [Ruegeria arenilitoris]|uniref:ABC transporter substrate-binding protein n=1 Tax=Ruegeria arenilitoris TaxID=1173585 RepID=UPI001C2B8080
MGFVSMRSISHKLLHWMSALIVALPSGAVGQSDTATIPRIGLLTWSACEEAWLSNSSGPFLRGLGEFGYKPGESVLIECRSAGKSYDGLSEAAADLAKLPLDVIVGDSEPVAHAVRTETSTIPMVMIISGDPVDGGLAQSLAKPGGNVTGVTYYATELTAKRLELLAELLPELTNVGVLANPNVAYMPFEEDAKRAASRLGITATVYQVREPDDIVEAFLRMKADGAQAVFVLPDLMLANQVTKIAELSLDHGLPSMGWGGWFTPAGFLMAYSSDYYTMIHRLAFYVDQILSGANPGDLPIEQPTTFSLSINMKTAEALGVEVPQGLLLLADEVIE